MWLYAFTVALLSMPSNLSLRALSFEKKLKMNNFVEKKMMH
jgi:hypothetical protein